MTSPDPAKASDEVILAIITVARSITPDGEHNNSYTCTGGPSAVNIADGHARSCQPLQDGLTVRRCPACQGRGGFPVAMGLGPGEQIPCPRCHGSGREATA